MEQFSERQRIELALIWALALLLIYVLVLAPYFDAYRASALAERAAAETSCARVDAYQRLLLDDTRALEKLGARQARVADALPEERGQGAFIRTVERLAQRSGVTIESISPRENDTRMGTFVYPMEFRFHGQYFDVLSFLHGVQELPRGIAFGDFSLTSEGDELHCVLQLKIAAHTERTGHDEDALVDMRDTALPKSVK